LSIARSVLRIAKGAALAPVIGVIFLAAGSSGLMAADVTFERLLNPEPHNWLMVHRDLHRAAPFGARSDQQVEHQEHEAAVRGGDRRHIAQRIAAGDAAGRRWFMYVIDGWGVVYKIDVRSGTHGRTLWKMDPGMKRYGRIRGVALWGNLVISPTGKDGRVIATDKESGKIVWDKIFPIILSWNCRRRRSR
jgi:alcohol dehydrogenase (cytochrome c)